jgi:hypothetical protein
MKSRLEHSLSAPFLRDSDIADLARPSLECDEHYIDESQGHSKFKPTLSCGFRHGVNGHIGQKTYVRNTYQPPPICAPRIRRIFVWFR